MAEVLVCSHRGPVAFHRTAGGFQPKPAGAGGLIAVVLPAVERLGGTWIFAPNSAEDRELAKDGTRVAHGSVTYRVLELPSAAHDDHYRVIYAGLLVPLFHYLLPFAQAPTFAERLWSAWEGYRLVNEVYGEAIRSERDKDVVLVEDAHLMLVAAAARRQGGGPDAPLAYFHHLPWCEPEYFGVLPEAIRDEILTAMLSFDSVGFHVPRWVDAFAACCERFLPTARRTGDSLDWQGRSVRLVAAPAAVDAVQIAERAESPKTLEWRAQLAEIAASRRLIVRVERTDPSKNAVRGLEAYELLLERRPELAESTCLLMVATSVRQWLDPYRRYTRACHAAAERINRRFSPSNESEAPICLHLTPDPYEFDHHRALAALGLAETLFVNPLFDGLNIVPMEGVIAGDPSVILSTNAGAHAEFAEHVLSVNPFDVAGTALALEHALDQPLHDRPSRAAALRRIATARTPMDWVRARL